jgi:hypothetical protein
VAGPVLGVDRVVLDGWVEPQAITLLAVVERRLQGRRRGAPAPPSPTPAPPARPRGPLLGVLVLLFGALGLGRLKLGRDQGVVLRAQVDLIVVVRRGRRGFRLAIGYQPLLMLKGLYLLDRDLQLVGDPSIGTALSDPGADLIELRSQRFAPWHGRRLLQACSRRLYAAESDPSPPLAACRAGCSRYAHG